MKLIYLISVTIIIFKSSNPQNTSIISIAICEIIRNFYTKYSRNVDIIDFGGSQGELVEKIMKNLNNSMTVTLKKLHNSQVWTNRLKNQSILLFSNFEDFDNFNKKDLIELEYIYPIRFLVYCKNVEEFELSKLKTDLVIVPYYYFIIQDQINDKLKLFTFENRNDLQYCHELQRLVPINEFSVKSQNWINKSIFPKKYQNFYGCKMKLGSFYAANNFIRFFDKYGRIVPISEKIDGPLGNVLNDVAERLNFSLIFVACLEKNCRDIIEVFYLYNVIYTTTLDGHAFATTKMARWRNVMLNIQCS